MVTSDIEKKEAGKGLGVLVGRVWPDVGAWERTHWEGFWVQTKTIFMSYLGPSSSEDSQAGVRGACLLSLRTPRQTSVAGIEQLLEREQKEIWGPDYVGSCGPVWELWHILEMQWGSNWRFFCRAVTRSDLLFMRLSLVAMWSVDHDHRGMLARELTYERLLRLSWWEVRSWWFPPECSNLGGEQDPTWAVLKLELKTLPTECVWSMRELNHHMAYCDRACWLQPTQPWAVSI